MPAVLGKVHVPVVLGEVLSHKPKKNSLPKKALSHNANFFFASKKTFQKNTGFSAHTF